MSRLILAALVAVLAHVFGLLAIPASADPGDPQIEEYRAPEEAPQAPELAPAPGHPGRGPELERGVSTAIMLQSSCFQPLDLAEQLDEKWQEHLFAVFKSATGEQVSIFFGLSKSVTIGVLRPDGSVCLLNVGQGLRINPRPQLHLSPHDETAPSSGDPGFPT